jgi:hypothetical protein
VAREVIAPMQDEKYPVEFAVFDLLRHEGGRPWSDTEVAREIGDSLQAEDALAQLQRWGLVHRLGGFAWITRAAAFAARFAG